MKNGGRRCVDADDDDTKGLCEPERIHIYINTSQSLFSFGIIVIFDISLTILILD